MADLWESLSVEPKVELKANLWADSMERRRAAHWEQQWADQKEYWKVPHLVESWESQMVEQWAHSEGQSMVHCLEQRQAGSWACQKAALLAAEWDQMKEHRLAGYWVC